MACERTSASGEALGCDLVSMVLAINHVLQQRIHTTSNIVEAEVDLQLFDVIGREETDSVERKILSLRYNPATYPLVVHYVCVS
jgi:hypothetical protein